MKMLLSILMLFVFTLAGCPDQHHEIRQLTFTDDTPTLYADELRMIFGDYTVGDRMARHIDGEDCSCGYHQDTVDDDLWEITYTDACGQEMTCLLNNCEPLCRQQVRWLTDQIQRHFLTHQVADVYGGLMGGGSYCFCFIGRVCSSYRGGNEEEYAHVETCDAYLASLEENGPLMPIASLSYAEIFDLLPIRLSVNIRLADQDLDRDAWAEHFTHAAGLLETLARRMADEIGDNLNLTASVYSDVQTFEPDNRSAYLNCLRGEPTDLLRIDYEHALFLSYKGKFW